jgi:tripartite ATP-independent transporter DctP family solute receptor
MIRRRHMLLTAGALAAPTVARAQQARTLRIGSALDPQHPIIIGANRMVARLQELSGGSLRAAIFPSSQLGAQREMWQNVQAGVLDGVIDASASMVNFVSQFGVLDLPYLVPDVPAAFRLLDGPMVDAELVARGARAGLRVVNFWEVTFRNIYTRRPVNSIADLAGLKIRVIPNPSFIALFRELGAAPTPMAFGEIYSALQQGVIDGAENDNVTFLSIRHAEVARNLAITNHMMLVNTFVMSERQFARLTPEQQGWVREASLAGRETVTAERTAREARALADIAAAGVTITRPDLAPFVAAGRRTYQQSEDRLGRELVERFAAAARG